jgi:hypothetical protein
MDSSADEIEFNEFGECNFCLDARALKRIIIKNNLFGDWINSIKNSLTNRIGSEVGILGLSGGVDSSYLLHLLANFDIRPLVVHIDCGWNSYHASRNIFKLVNKLNLDLETIVIDWNKVRTIQLAFLKSGIKNQDIPQDYIYFSTLFNYAESLNIKHVFLGSNYATENILPKTWGESALDFKLINSIYKKYNHDSELDLPKIDSLTVLLKSKILNTYKIHSPLNFLNYSKNIAMQTLIQNYGWEDYGGKHKESIFTSYYQDVYLPKRFGIVKNKAHLSSLIVNGEISRPEAILTLESSLKSESEASILRSKVARKLEIEYWELEEYEMLQPRIRTKFKKNIFRNFLAKILEKILLFLH